MVFFILISILYGIPISIGIFIIYFLLKQIGYHNTGRIVRKILFIGLGLFIFISSFYAWWVRQHYVSFQMGKKYHVELHIEEIDSFLEYPVDFEMEIENIKTGTKQEFEFSTGEGPYLKFIYSDEEPDIIKIRGLKRNEGSKWGINLKKNRISHLYTYDENDSLANQQIYTLDGFKIIKSYE